ncbi:hypothetical protein BASA81_000209 [Batrachochytrium salamandrivorans]|nr:hypothetical protein BASA81_000209 [Batrachochytrium salamandrivorans]
MNLFMLAAILQTVLLMTVAATQHKRFAGLTSSFCTLQLDGTVFCTGDNSYGNFGLGASVTTTKVVTPTQIPSSTEITDISVGDTHTCVVDVNGQAKCTGSNQYYNQLGDGTSVDKKTLTNVLGLETGVSQIFAGPQTSCALLDGGGARCWGYNFYGALGDDHTCFLSSLGKIWCTGDNASGQLGTNTEVDSDEPVPVVGLGSTNTFVSVSCAYSHTCAVTSGGAVVCWGSNWDGELGVGNRVDSSLPVQAVGLATGAASVWLSWSSSFVIMQDGSVRSFGLNTNAQLGNGNTTRMISPVSFASGITNVKELRGGEETTCVLLQDDSVRCLGSNSYGQFGAGSLTPSSSLALVAQLAVVSSPPSDPPTLSPTKVPTLAPSPWPTAPTTTGVPTLEPTKTPTKEPTTRAPTAAPTLTPTKEPTFVPSHSPTKEPTTLTPTLLPTLLPTNSPTLPTPQPTRRPTMSGDMDRTGGSLSTDAASAAVLVGTTVLVLLM